MTALPLLIGRYHDGYIIDNIRKQKKGGDVNFVRRLVFYGLLILIAVAPLPFGSNRPWALSILSLWVGVLVLFDAFAAFAAPVLGESQFMRRIAIPTILFIPVLIWDPSKP